MDGGHNTAPALIGPNAVIQLGEAMRVVAGQDAARHLFDLARCPELLEHPPDKMIDEKVPVRLFRTLWRDWPAATAHRVACEAGHRTAEYIMANRVPGPVRFLLRALPGKIGARLLLSAIQKHAWTFAGSGTCQVEARICLISIKSNPLRMPDGAWHGAVFERLFQRLIAHGTRVQHSTTGAQADRFAIELP